MWFVQVGHQFEIRLSRQNYCKASECSKLVSLHELTIVNKLTRMSSKLFPVNWMLDHFLCQVDQNVMSDEAIKNVILNKFSEKLVNSHVTVHTIWMVPVLHYQSLQCPESCCPMCCPTHQMYSLYLLHSHVLITVTVCVTANINKQYTTACYIFILCC